jgi:hypothetical protein
MRGPILRKSHSSDFPEDPFRDFPERGLCAKARFGSNPAAQVSFIRTAEVWAKPVVQRGRHELPSRGFQSFADLNTDGGVALTAAVRMTTVRSGQIGPGAAVPPHVSGWSGGWKTALWDSGTGPLRHLTSVRITERGLVNGAKRTFLGAHDLSQRERFP